MGFNWIGADSLYGAEPLFLRSLDEMGKVFVIDIHKDHAVYLEYPNPKVPEGKTKNVASLN
jgi:hypothetical protein